VQLASGRAAVAIVLRLVHELALVEVSPTFAPLPVRVAGFPARTQHVDLALGQAGEHLDSHVSRIQQQRARCGAQRALMLRQHRPQRGTFAGALDPLSHDQHRTGQHRRLVGGTQNSILERLQRPVGLGGIRLRRGWLRTGARFPALDCCRCMPQPPIAGGRFDHGPIRRGHSHRQVQAPRELVY
jgi:hypothetical protein